MLLRFQSRSCLRSVVCCMQVSCLASAGVPVECIQCGLPEQIDAGQRRAKEVKVGQSLSSRSSQCGMVACRTFECSPCQHSSSVAARQRHKAHNFWTTRPRHADCELLRLLDRLLMPRLVDAVILLPPHLFCQKRHPDNRASNCSLES